MKTIYEVNGKPLLYERTWLFRSVHTLQLSGEKFAVLREMKLLNSLNKVTASVEDGSWIFQRKGSFSRPITVHETTSKVLLAEYEYDRGLLRLFSGRKFYWHGKRKLPIHWEGGFNFRFDKGPELINYEGRWLNERGEEVLRLIKMTIPDKELLSMRNINVAGSKEQIQIDISLDSPVARNELSLLAVLGWYIIIFRESAGS